jgi:hypothetical protein
MLIQVEEARHLSAHRVWLRFSDGRQGEVDLADALAGPVFEPLHDPSYFGRFAVDETVVWPNGADFAPEFLYGRLPAPAGLAAP